MNCFNNFNDLFKSQSSNINNISVFNELLPELKNEVADTLRCRVNQLIATDYNVTPTDNNYDRYVNSELKTQIDGRCPEVIELLRSYWENRKDSEELLNDLHINFKKEFKDSVDQIEYLEDCERCFEYDGQYGVTYADFDDADPELQKEFDEAYQEYMDECLRTIPDYYIEELTKDALIEYFFDTHAEETKQAALDLIKKDGPNYF